ncbi:MAG: DUF1062 domain-containing protein [Candidatus Latescibacteria bacterium]|nr:DUF1062 domain-containing protein [Candidatus Latescibacterota bacterium]
MSNKGRPDRIWHIVPLRPPAVRRHCQHCQRRQWFICSEKFRLNRTHGRIDIWLIYKCPVCSSTWNCTLFSRLKVAQLNEDLHRRMVANDRRTVWRFAFDRGVLRANQAEWERTVDYRVEGEPIDLQTVETDTLRILVTCPLPLPVRVEGLLARQFGLSRSRVKGLLLDGLVRLEAGSKRIQEDTWILVDVAAIRAL